MAAPYRARIPKSLRMNLGSVYVQRLTVLSHAQVLMNKLWFEQSLNEAVEKPRLHSELVPDRNVSYEKIPSDTSGKYRMGKEILEGLEERGHNVAGEKLIAVVQAVFRDPEKGIFAKSDPRKRGAPAGE